MVRLKIVTSLISLMLSASPAQANQEAHTDQDWADIGKSFIKVAPQKKVQRDFSQISKSEGLFSIGSFVRVVRDINLRRAPGGEKMWPVYKGSDFQILGVATQPDGKRFYKIKDKGEIGYLYAGTKRSYAKWLKQVWLMDGKIIAQPGDQIKIKRRRGAKLSVAPDEKHFYSIPKGEKARVTSVKETEDGRVFYKVKYRARSGFIEAGSIDKIAQAKTWTEVK